MNKIATFIATAIVACFALIPPIYFVVPRPQSEFWPWMVLISGLFGFYTIFIKTEWFIKAIAIGAFINCFYSVSPDISFSAYICLLVGCYLYIFFTRVTHWDIVFKVIQSLLFLNVLIIAMQLVRHDQLLNWGEAGILHYGVLGPHMQMASFAIVLSSVLVSFSPLNFIFPFGVALFCHSSWGLLTSAVGLGVYLNKYSFKLFLMAMAMGVLVSGLWSLHQGKLHENFTLESGRAIVWEKSMKLASKHQLTGWGIGTYKDVFPGLSGLICTPWKNAHNFIIQLIFEVGYPVTICLLLGILRLSWALFWSDLWSLLAGLSMIILDGLVHFPDRMIQTAPMLFIFFALCRFNLRRYT